MPDSVDLTPILTALNQQAHEFEFGCLQELREQHGRVKRRPTHLPFPRATDKEWAHHVGGWQELQFNVASDDGHLRWGVAISLQASKSLRDPTVIYPKLVKLNRFLEAQSEYLRNREYLMWEYTGQGKARTRSRDRAPHPFRADLYKQGDFLFLGKHGPIEAFEAATVLRDFDRLLPLYKFVEFESEKALPLLSKPGPFEFKPDESSSSRPTVSRPRSRRIAGEFDVSHRHDDLQAALKQQLNAESGVQVATELKDGRGGRIDLVACRNGELEFYEIKTGTTAKQCVRDALGQLLEYAYRAPAIRPKKLFVVGERLMDSDTEEYLRLLRDELCIPIWYQQVEGSD